MRPLLAALALAGALIPISVSARDLGQWDQVDPKTHAWFEGLTDETGGLCCSFADGHAIEAPDWEQRPDGSYWVRLDGAWQIVPKLSLVKEPNRVGFAVLWTNYYDGVRSVRCFMPGSRS